jgi:hypothetical protein
MSKNKIYGECSTCKENTNGEIFSIYNEEGWQPIAVGNLVQFEMNVRKDTYLIRLHSTCSNCKSALIAKFIRDGEQFQYLGFVREQFDIMEFDGGAIFNSNS